MCFFNEKRFREHTCQKDDRVAAHEEVLRRIFSLLLRISSYFKKCRILFVQIFLLANTFYVDKD